MILEPVRSPHQQLGQITQLLAGSGLPTEDLEDVDWLVLMVWKNRQEVHGVGGVERCRDSVLLSSVAIDEESRGNGLASRLVGDLHQTAQDQGHEVIYLMTTTASDYFSERFGYQVVRREDAPLDIVQSSQFSALCPASAVLMKKRLQSFQTS